MSEWKGLGLKPGTYRLTATVDNPKPDRRYTDNWTKRARWDSGRVFLALERGREGCCGSRMDRHTDLVIEGERFTHSHKFQPWDDAYKALAAKLEPITETVDALFTRLDVEQRIRYFAAFMIETQRWTLQEFETLWEAYNARNEE